MKILPNLLTKYVLILLPLISSAKPVAEHDQVIKSETTTLNIDFTIHQRIGAARPIGGNNSVVWSSDKVLFLSKISKLGLPQSSVDTIKDTKEDTLYALLILDDLSKGIEKITLDRGLSRIYIDLYQTSGGFNLSAKDGHKRSHYIIVSFNPSNWTKKPIKHIWARVSQPGKSQKIK